MTRVVWKYVLEPGVNDLRVPGGSRVLHVGPEANGMIEWRDQLGFGHREPGPAVWIEHDRPPSTAPRYLVDSLRLTAIGTGHDVPEDAVPLGSAWCGEFMWHVYELAR